MRWHLCRNRRPEPKYNLHYGWMLHTCHISVRKQCARPAPKPSFLLPHGDRDLSTLVGAHLLSSNREPLQSCRRDGNSAPLRERNSFHDAARWGASSKRNGGETPT